jgi:RHS repeat-associated protein
VTYSYDSLNRLIQASTTGSEYGLNWTYDGFGNQTSQQVFKGSGYNNNLNYDGQTNRIATPGYGYDANGNLTVMPFLTMQYDVQNRMTQSVSTNNGTKLYAYAPSGSRVAQSAPPDPVNYQYNTWSITFYGPDGRRAADCSAAYLPDAQYPQRLVFQASCDEVYVYFGGKLVRKEYKPYLQDGRWVYYGNQPSAGATLATDRLGSVQTGSRTTYYPYGEERDATNNDTQKFATYTRDSATSLDYANARYYSSQIARFTTADPYSASAGPAEPQSWNRYAYVQNDPVNANDPAGLCTQLSWGLTMSGAICYEGWAGSSWSAPPAGGFSNQSVIVNGFGGEGAAGEANYVAGTVVPAYVRSAFARYPGLQYGELISGGLPGSATSAWIFWGSPEERESAIEGVLRGTLSALTFLPQMFLEGWASMLLNDDPRGALQVAGSLALAAGPGAVLRALTSELPATTGSLIVGETPVLGGSIFTSQYAGVPGYSTFSTSNYSWSANVAWLNRQVATGQSFLLGAGGPYTTFEVEYLAGQGYTPVGAFLVPRAP